MPYQDVATKEFGFALEQVVVASPEHVASELSGETVILSLDRGTYFGLDQVGTHVWQLIQTPNTVGDVCRHLCEIFDVDLERCRQDVAVLLRDMQQAGLLQARPAAAA